VRFVTVDTILANYKIYYFINEPDYDGATIYQIPDIPTKYQPSRALLKHHFRMAVLLNMKGRERYPEWDDDISEGYDPVAEISNCE
jgi:hypothetical protein